MNIKIGPPTQAEWLPWEEIEKPRDNKAFFVWGKDPHEEIMEPYLYLWHSQNFEPGTYQKLVNLTTGTSSVTTHTWVFKPIKNYAIVVTRSEE